MVLISGAFNTGHFNKPPVLGMFYKCRFIGFVILHVVATLGFLATGAYVMTRAHLNWRPTCEQSYHVKRYLRLNLIFIAISFVTYYLFSRDGCEQAARARATALTVKHLAFSLWGALTWRQIDEMCASAAGTLLVFHHTAVVFNGAYFLFFLLHEMCNPRVDWTVMPVVQLRKTEFVNLSPYSPNDRPEHPPATSMPPGHFPPQYISGDVDITNPKIHHLRDEYAQETQRDQLPLSAASQGGLGAVAGIRTEGEFPPLWEVNPQTHSRLASHVQEFQQHKHQRRNSQP